MTFCCFQFKYKISLIETAVSDYSLLMISAGAASWTRNFPTSSRMGEFRFRREKPYVETGGRGVKKRLSFGFRILKAIFEEKGLHIQNVWNRLVQKQAQSKKGSIRYGADSGLLFSICGDIPPPPPTHTQTHTKKRFLLTYNRHRE
jgi:hypothetical protein